MKPPVELKEYPPLVLKERIEQEISCMVLGELQHYYSSRCRFYENGGSGNMIPVSELDLDVQKVRNSSSLLNTRKQKKTLA